MHYNGELAGYGDDRLGHAHLLRQVDSLGFERGPFLGSQQHRARRLGKQVAHQLVAALGNMT